MTSPPYYALRDYGKENQIGREGAPEEYIGHLVSVFCELKRVLRSDGTFWLNIADCYSRKSYHGLSGCKPKELMGLPWLLALTLRKEGWFLRSDIIWQKDNPMNVLVRISLEGHNEEINDFIRGVGTFKKAIEFSNICRENNLSIGYSFTINSINEKYFSDMLQLAEDSFADEIEMSEILNVNQNLNISSLMLSEKQSKNFRINTLKGFSISKAFRKGMGLYRYKKGTEYICSAGTKNIFIDINGDVYPCNLFANHNEYFAGNVFSEDLLEIWRKSKVFIELRNLKKEDIEECANCPASENCKGGCRARAVFESGSLRGKMEKGFCKVTNMMVEEMNHNAFVHN